MAQPAPQPSASPPPDSGRAAHEDARQPSGQETITASLRHLVDDITAEEITFGEVAERLHEKGFGLLLAFFSMPTCIPIVVPPLTWFFCLPLLFFALQMLAGRPYIWLPPFLAQRKVSRATLVMVVDKAQPYIHKIESIMKPRLFPAGHPRVLEILMGAFCVLFALTIVAPIPFSNVVTSFGVLFLSLGLLARDGLWLVLGILVGLLGMAITLAMAYFGVEVIRYILT